MTTPANQSVEFIENAVPPLRNGLYTLTAEHDVPNQSPGHASATTNFVVQGERFTIQPSEIDSVFPPALANGEFDDVFPHVVLTRTTLPWERRIDTPGSSKTYPKSPWLAVLLLDGPDAPAPQAVTVAALVPDTVTITGGNITRTGSCPAATLSYPAALLTTLEYGETPDDACNVIDIPLDMFHAVAPAATDLEYLAHVRATDTADATDSDLVEVRSAIVVGNRIPATDTPSRAVLVSLEGMADFLPAADGTRSSSIDATITNVRLIVFRAWDFTANAMDQTLEALLENLDTPPVGRARSTVLTLPIVGDPPTSATLATAMTAQAAGTLTDSDATVLVQNALLLGYVPMGHHLRHGGHTVSFYRGPLAPIAVARAADTFYTGPDAANAYNPQTGLFDVSFGAAWELGRLLALQNPGMANALYRWKQQVTHADVVIAETALLDARLGTTDAFAHLRGRRARMFADRPPPFPPEVLDWFARLTKLDGVPFNYLVPDERMLPPESLRFFQLDAGWVDALIDGAFAIGRATASTGSLEHRHIAALKMQARTHAGGYRANRAPVTDASDTVSGFILRSAAVSGWPNLRILAYTDPDGEPVTPIRVVALSADTLLVLCPGLITQVVMREPPETQHLGIEGTTGSYHTTLRSVVGGPGTYTIGQQYDGNPRPTSTSCDPAGTHAWGCVSMRGSGRTVDVAASAATVAARLTNDFGQVLPNGFTAAEYALEFTKGVVEVRFRI